MSSYAFFEPTKRSLSLFMVLFFCLFFKLLAQDFAEKLSVFPVQITEKKFQIFSVTAGFTDKIAQAFPKLTTQIEEKLGIVFPEKTKIYLCHNNALFESILGKRYHWVSAVALPDFDSILIRTNKATPLQNHWKDTLTHEMVHLFMIHYERKLQKRIPKWYHEGVAEAVSGQGHFDNPQMELALNSYLDKLPSLTQLRDSFRATDKEIALDYAVSRSVCGYLEKEFGASIHQELLRELKTSPDFDRAFLKVTQTPLAHFEKKWKSSLKKSFSWLAFVAMNLSLFSFLPLLLFFLYWKKKKQRQKIYRQWEEEEEALEANSDRELYPKY